MHPIERLRMVARAAGEGPALVAQEAAGALVAFGDDPAGLVTACRRLVDRQPTSGPIWWLAARVLTSTDPTTEAWRAVEQLQDDPTAERVAAALPDGAVVTVVGLGEHTADALVRRGDVAEMERRERLAATMGMILSLLVVAVLVLMVFKPGGPGS